MLELKNVCKIYKTGETELIALNNINLHVEEGEFISITGHSGSGKSTLMNILGCLDIPTSGDYFFDKQNVKNLSDNTLAKIRNKKIGFVFQAFNLLARYSAVKNVELPLIYSGVQASKRKNLSLSMLKLVGLAKRAIHNPNELSGGECQRVSIARALVCDPNFILADEPTGNLDSKTSEEIVNIFKKLNNELNKTIVIVTHNPEIARESKRSIVLKDGLIIKDAKN
jgi:putative ABC transport system ATP-binding protein